MGRRHRRKSSWLQLKPNGVTETRVSWILPEPGSIQHSTTARTCKFCPYLKNRTGRNEGRDASFIPSALCGPLWEEEREVGRRATYVTLLPHSRFCSCAGASAFVSTDSSSPVNLFFLTTAPNSGLPVKCKTPLTDLSEATRFALPRTELRKPPHASMDLRKWLWSICAPLGLVLTLSKCELTAVALRVHGH